MGTPFDLIKGLAAGPFGTPNRHPTPKTVRPEGFKDTDWERAISMFRCSYSFVGQARGCWLPPPIGGVLWFGEDAPHPTCYIPFYAGNTETPKAFASGSRSYFDKDSAWWAFDFVSNFADLKFSYMIEDIKAVQQELEGQFFAMQPAIEAAALKMYKKDPAAAKRFLTSYSRKDIVCHTD